MRMNDLSTARFLGAMALVLVVFLIGSNAQQEPIAPLAQSIDSTLVQAGIPVPPPGNDPSMIQSVGRPESPFRYDPFVLMPHFLDEFIYEYGVLVRPGQPETTLLNTISPGITLQAGSSWTLDYTAIDDLYSNHKFKDTLGHSASIVGRYSFADWTAQVNQSYIYSSRPLVETGTQTTVQQYSTALNITHQLGKNFLLESIASQSFRFAAGYPDTYQWPIDVWLHYRFSVDFDAAIGAGAGYIHQSQGSDSDYTRPEAKVSWQATEKLMIAAGGGFEDRVYLDYPRTNLDTPTYDISATYTPVPTTSLVLSLSRQISPSYQSDESSRVASESLSLNQRLLGILYLTCGVTRGALNYISEAQTSAVLRSDTQTTINARLSSPVLRSGTLSLFCYRPTNSSSITGFSYTSTQIGADFSYRY